MKRYDLLVVGTGAANIVLEAALEKGLQCAQVEKGKFGGTCLTRGCIPTKVMVTVADTVRDARAAARLGVEMDSVRVDWKRMSERVWQKIDESEDLKDFYLKQENLDVYQGRARFIEEKVLEVVYPDGSVSDPMTADKIVLGIGGRTNIPDMAGLDGIDYLTSENFFGASYPNEAYRSLVIIGGGAIGCEFAHIFSAMGTKVDLVQHNVRLLPKEDAEISEDLRVHFEKAGIRVHLNKNTPSIRKEAAEVVLTLRDRTTGESSEVRAEKILIAPGIRSNTDWIDIEKSGIRTDERGWIETNEFLETSAENVWALGDVNGLQQFRHKANYEADIISYNLFLREKESEVRTARYDLVPATTFTYPQVAHVGLTEEEAKEAGYNVLAGKHYYYQTAKGFAYGYEPQDDTNAYVKLVIDRDSYKILGVHAIGHEATLLIQPIVDLLTSGENKIMIRHADIASDMAKKFRAEDYVRYLDPHNISTIMESMAVHPTLAELISWAPQLLLNQQKKKMK